MSEADEIWGIKAMQKTFPKKTKQVWQWLVELPESGHFGLWSPFMTEDAAKALGKKVIKYAGPWQFEVEE